MRHCWPHYGQRAPRSYEVISAFTEGQNQESSTPMADMLDVMNRALDMTEAALAAPVIDLEAENRKRRMADKLKFWHGVSVGDRVFISHRREAGKIIELITIENTQYASRNYAKFRVLLDSGEEVIEHPEHLTKSVRS
jgi:hypothetical protein